jgi:hypothetical protein
MANTTLTGDASFYKVDPADPTGGAATIRIAKQLSGTLTFGRDILESTTKDSGRVKEFIYGNFEFSGAFNGYIGSEPLLDLDGSTEYAWVADHADFDLTTDLTIEVMIVPDKITGVQHLVHKSDTLDGYQLNLNGDEVEFVLENSGATDATITTTAANLAVAKERRIKAVFDGGTTTAKIYDVVSGAEITSSVSGTVPATLGTNATRVTIGTDDTASGNFYDGKKGLALISASGTLDAIHIAPTNSQAYWGFEGNLNDSSGNSHTLTGVNIATADYGDLTYLTLRNAIINKTQLAFDFLEDGTGLTYSGFLLQASIAQTYDQNAPQTYAVTFTGTEPLTIT